MATNEQDIETLTAIGLNSTQAKVYLTLLRLGSAKANMIWRSSKVARQDIYRILNELEAKSLVEKIIDTPTEFKAIPLRDGLSFLLKEKVTEYISLKKKTEELLERFATRQKENTMTKEVEFKIISTKDAYLRILKEAAITTQTSIDVIDSFDNCYYRQMTDFELVMKLVKKNVKFRCITNAPKDGQCLPKTFTARNNHNFEIRFIPTEPVATLRIDDKKRVELTIITDIRKLDETPRLFSDSPCLVTILQDYFERVWNEATPTQILYPTGKFNCILPTNKI